MIRSPEQQFAFAKRLPISELAKVLQGQSDVVDMSIAQMVLREKTREEKIKQGAQAQPEAQQPPVVERDLMAAGVAALPADVDVGLAGGGIVAFAGPDGSFVQGEPPPRFYVDPQGNVFDRLSGQQVSSGASGSQSRALTVVEPPKATPTFSGPPDLDEVARRAGRFLFNLGTIGARRTIPGQILKAQDLGTGEAEYLEGLKRLRDMGYTDQQMQEMSEATRKQLLDQKKKTPAQTTPAPTPTGTAPAAPPPPQAKDTGATSGIAALPSPPSFESTAAEAERIASKLFPKQTVVVPTAKEAVQQEKAYLTEAGFDPNLYKNQIAAIRKEAEGDKSMRQDAINMRLLEAGLGILGGESPYAFVNIGKGASPALKGFQEDIKEIKKLERDRNKEILALQTAENQVAAGIGGKASERVQNAQKRLDDIEKQQGERKLNLMTHLASNNTQEYVARLNAETQRSATAETKMYREETLQADKINKAIAAANAEMGELLKSPNTASQLMDEKAFNKRRMEILNRNLILFGVDPSALPANEPPVAARYDAKGNRIK